MYCAVTGSSNTVSVPSVMTVVESRVQVTVVAGPPVEIQARVNWEAWSDSTTLAILPDIVISPVKTIVMKNNYPANTANNLNCFHISLQRLIPSLSYSDDHEPRLYQYCNDKHQMVSQHCFYDVEQLSEVHESHKYHHYGMAVTVYFHQGNTSLHDEDPEDHYNTTLSLPL